MGASGRPGPVTRVAAVRHEDGTRRVRSEEVVGEEPLEVRVRTSGEGPSTVTVTMRTPGQDFELAVGLLVTEGVVAPSARVLDVRYCDLDAGVAQRYNVVTVTVDTPLRRLPGRTLAATASCGLCGTASLAELVRRRPPLGDAPPLALDLLVALPDRLREAQRTFDRTGGLHAAGIVDVTSGELLCVREDVGRHNALDKVLGWAALRRRLPLAACAIVVSGRVSFELVQKAAVAGVPHLAAVSAPSSLAVRAADELGMLLAGFVREGRATIYCGEWRLAGGRPVHSDAAPADVAHAARWRRSAPATPGVAADAAVTADG